jgi:hypothetical protein
MLAGDHRAFTTIVANPAPSREISIAGGQGPAGAENGGPDIAAAV